MPRPLPEQEPAEEGSPSQDFNSSPSHWGSPEEGGGFPTQDFDSSPSNPASAEQPPRPRQTARKSTGGGHHGAPPADCKPPKAARQYLSSDSEDDLPLILLSDSSGGADFSLGEVSTDIYGTETDPPPGAPVPGRSMPTLTAASSAGDDPGQLGSDDDSCDIVSMPDLSNSDSGAGPRPAAGAGYTSDDSSTSDASVIIVHEIGHSDVSCCCGRFAPHCHACHETFAQADAENQLSEPNTSTESADTTDVTINDSFESVAVVAVIDSHTRSALAETITIDTSVGSQDSVAVVAVIDSHTRSALAETITIDTSVGSQDSVAVVAEVKPPGSAGRPRSTR